MFCSQRALAILFATGLGLALLLLRLRTETENFRLLSGRTAIFGPLSLGEIQLQCGKKRQRLELISVAAPGRNSSSQNGWKGNAWWMSNPSEGPGPCKESCPKRQKAEATFL